MDDYYLYNDTAKKLFSVVKDLPIIDYHCHLSLAEIKENKSVENLARLWLCDDHYKWRQMRTFGINERLITGSASDKEKFDAYISMLTYAIGSPLYAWSKLELKRYFDYDGEISVKCADRIWEQANAIIKERGYTPQKLIEMSNVEAVQIVEDIDNDLSIYKNLKFKFAVSPVLRCDTLLSKPKKEAIETFDLKLKNASQYGVKSVDIGITGLDESDKNKFNILRHTLEKSYERNLSVQLHFSAARNNNKRMYERLGADKGFDSISCAPYIDGLNALLGGLERVGRTIVFNLNPADNAALASLCGNFVGDESGKVQLGAAWWFNDSAAGMEAQLRTTCNLSLLSTFVGMLTDSRSLISYPRHEYFRRILCNFVGGIAERGEFTQDFEILSKIVKDVSYCNAKRYFGYEEQINENSNVRRGNAAACANRLSAVCTGGKL